MSRKLDCKWQTLPQAAYTCAGARDEATYIAVCRQYTDLSSTVTACGPLAMQYLAESCTGRMSRGSKWMTVICANEPLPQP